MKLPLLFTLPALLLCACMNTAPVSDGAARLFLPSPASPAPADPGLPAPAVGIRQVSLPEHLQSEKIVLSNGPSELVQRPFDLWGAPLEDAVARTLLHSFAIRADAGRVDIYPWTDGIRRDIELRILFDRFEGDVDGTVSVRARIVITSATDSSADPVFMTFEWTGHGTAGTAPPSPKASATPSTASRWPS
jgi:uncharacterized lipoprotein YmbA